MLRTPTHIVELGTNTTSPLIQKFHAHTTTNNNNNNTGTTHYQQQQQQSKLYHDHYYQQQQQQQQKQQPVREYRFQIKAATTKPAASAQKQSAHYTKEHLTTTTTTTTTSTTTTKGLLSSAPFSFKKIKKSKAVAVATATTITTPTAVTAKSNGVSGNHVYATTATSTFLNLASNCTNNNNNNNNYLTAASTNEQTTNLKSSSSSSLSSATQQSTISASNSGASNSSTTSSASAAAATTANSCSNSSIAAATTIATIAATATATMSPTSQTPTRTSLFDSCHRKIRLIGGGPVAFLGGLVAKARRKERDGDQNSTDTKLYLEESVLERKLPEADLKALVDLPAGLDYNEWLASHTLALFEHVNLVYGTISEFCTPSGCPDMTGPGNRTYLWFDEKGKKTRVAAPQYIDYVMTFTQKTVSDESIFPTKYANEFPSSFESIARKILRLQFHVIAHLYAAHFREIALLGLHTHLNLTFAHLTALHRRFNLIDEKETDVLRDLEVALRLTDDGQTASLSGDSSATADSSSGGGGSGSGSVGGGSGNTTHYNTAQQQHAHGAVEDVNSVQLAQQQQQSVVTAATLIDGDAAAPPICTQPEAQTKSSTTPAAVFGGGGGLIGGILGDLSSGEFGDTTRYCTSAVPSSNACNAATDSAAALANCNNAGPPALHLNFNNNHHPYHHHHHHHHHHQQQQQQHQQLHAHQQLQQHQQHSGLIQCNANNAPNANTVSASAGAVGATASAASTATATAAATTTTA